MKNITIIKVFSCNFYNLVGHNKNIILKEVVIMDKSHINKAIGCTVSSCEYHNNTQNYCSLSKIQVGTHETDPTMVECTDCMSFKKKMK